MEDAARDEQREDGRGEHRRVDDVLGHAEDLLVCEEAEAEVGDLRVGEQVAVAQRDDDLIPRAPEVLPLARARLEGEVVIALPRPPRALGPTCSRSGLG